MLFLKSIRTHRYKKDLNFTVGDIMIKLEMIAIIRVIVTL